MPFATREAREPKGEPLARGPDGKCRWHGDSADACSRKPLERQQSGSIKRRRKTGHATARMGQSRAISSHGRREWVLENAAAGRKGGRRAEVAKRAGHLRTPRDKKKRRSRVGRCSHNGPLVSCATRALFLRRGPLLVLFEPRCSRLAGRPRGGLFLCREAKRQSTLLGSPPPHVQIAVQKGAFFSYPWWPHEGSRSM